MTDPQPPRLRRRPRRAEPLQPDNPLRGDGTQEAGTPTPAPGPAPDGSGEDGSAQRAREQSDAALDNVREGYGD